MKAKTIVILVLIALFIIILIQNAYVVTVRLLFWEIGVSQIILLALAMFIGVVIGFAAAKVMGGAQRKENCT
jgi:uncharacterized integral membrane protein